jgi:23S rRNA (adenine2503-C2)-methyltransferase
MLDYPAIRSVLAELGEPEYRARQTYEAVTRSLVTSFDQITVLPASLRTVLAARLTVTDLTERTTLADRRGAAEKTLFEAQDGALVEAVLLHSRRRSTVCVSSQVGCSVGCPFCASGRGGLRRDLTAGEIVDQVLHFARRLRAEQRRVTNVVVMGMGEPFHNYDATLRACRLLNDGDGFGLAARAISVSTSGVVPGIGRFAAEDEQFNLAVSLHAATDALRDRLVPLNRRYPLDELFDACAGYVQRTHRKLLFEYVLLRGVNDGEDQVAALARRLRRPLYHLNLIAYNSTTPRAADGGEACAAEERAGGGFAAPTAAQTAAFAQRLRAAGVACTVRRSPGADIDAACGQLALREHQGAA